MGLNRCSKNIALAGFFVSAVKMFGKLLVFLRYGFSQGFVRRLLLLTFGVLEKVHVVVVFSLYIRLIISLRRTKRHSTRETSTQMPYAKHCCTVEYVTYYVPKYKQLLVVLVRTFVNIKNGMQDRDAYGETKESATLFFY